MIIFININRKDATLKTFAFGNQIKIVEQPFYAFDYQLHLVSGTRSSTENISESKSAIATRKLFINLISQLQ